MRRSRVLVFLIAAVSVGLAIAAGKRPFRLDEEPIELRVAAGYAIPVHSERAVLELDFAPGARYALVIGSLGPAEERFRVECRARSNPSGGEHVEPPQLLAPLISRGRPDCATGRFAASVSSPRTADLRSTRERCPSGDRSFALHVTDGNLDDPAQYVTVHAHPIADGRAVRVYLDDQQTPESLAPGLVKSLIELFDDDVIPQFGRTLGSYRDVDGDGRFAILLSPWLSRLQGGRTSVGGFVRGSDFQERLDRPFGNRCDMMYVNSQMVPGPHLRTLLLHEYAHAVCFSRRTADASGKPRFPDEEDWLNEAIAHATESLFHGGWTNLDHRIARYLSDPADFPLVVRDYYRAGLWRCHGCRGATYLFLRYCLEQFGPEVLNRIIANPARGTRNLELATGCPFDRLFRAWTLSLIDSNSRQPMVGPSATKSDATRQCCDGGAPGGSGFSGTPAGQGSLAPLDLYGPLGDWGLAGPRWTDWDVDGRPANLELKGTTATYLHVFASGSAGPRRICLTGSRGSRLQVSVVRLGADAPAIEVAASLVLPGAGTSPCSGRSSRDDLRVAQATRGAHRRRPRLQIEVQFVHGADLALEQVSAEQNWAETHRSVCVARTRLAELEEVGAADARVAPKSTARSETSQSESSQSAAGRNRRVFDLPADCLAASGVPIVVKVVARDGRGRAATGFTQLWPEKSRAMTGRLAQRSR